MGEDGFLMKLKNFKAFEDVLNCLAIWRMDCWGKDVICSWRLVQSSVVVSLVMRSCGVMVVVVKGL